MKNILARILFLVAMTTAALGQPMIPVNNISPLQTGVVLGRTDPGTGRAQQLTAGAGISFANGQISSSGSGSGAPINSPFITRTPDVFLTNEQALSLLGSGIMRVATVTGAVTSLGDPSTVGSGFMFGTSPSAISFPRVNANNSVTFLSAADFRTALSLVAIATSGSATDLTTGTLPAARLPAFTGDASTSAGASVITLATVNGNVGTFGNATTVPQITFDAKGRATSISNVTITGGSGNVTNNATLTAGRIVLGGGTTVVGITGAVLNGQLYVGNSTNGNMQLATLTAGDNITITNSPGGIMINSTASGTGNVTNNASLTNQMLTIGNGTTGIGTTTVSWNGSMLTVGAGGIGNITGNVATISTATITTLNANDINISNPVGAAAGGTGQSSYAVGDIIFASGATTLSKLAGVATGNVLLSGGVTTAPAYGKVDLTAHITGTLPRANGGTGLATAGTAGNVITSDGTNWTSQLPNQTAGIVVINSTLTVDDTSRGVYLTGQNAGATIAQWEVVYLDGSSTWQLADADGSGTYPARGISTAAYSSTDPATILISGAVRNDAWNFTPGGTVYISATAGGLTQTPPSTSTHKVQQVGFALTGDIVYFDFASGEYLTVE